MADASQQGEDESQESDENGSGQGQQRGQEPGDSQNNQPPGEGREGPSSSQNLAQGQQEEQQAGQSQQGQQAGQSQQGQRSMADANSGQRGSGSDFETGDRGNRLPTGAPLDGQPLFFDRPDEAPQQGPITGDDYGNWADRLSNIEEMVDQEDIRNGIAKVLDEARAMRIDFQRDNEAPQAGTINKRIADPLVELRQRLSEEIAKLNKENPIAPIDRDPVPSEFRDLVRRYYEELGAGE